MIGRNVTQTRLAISQARCLHLRRAGLFSGLASSELRELGDVVDTGLYQRGDIVYRVGDLADRIYVLTSGKIKISRAAADSRQLILYFIHPGSVFGELAITGEEQRTATATVIEDAFVCSVDRARFEEFVGLHPDAALEISRVIGMRRQRIERRILDLVTKDVRTRLAHTLAELAVEFGDEDERGIRIDLWLTQSDLAQLVGSTRETTSTVFNEFRRLGLVDSELRSIWVLDRDALAEYSCPPRAA